MDPLGGGPRAAYASRGLDQRIQIMLDKSVPHIGGRWCAFFVVVLIYALRVYYLHGFYIVTYGIGIFNLNLLIGFISPQVDPDQEGPTLPTTDGEFRPFVRRLPEFKFWLQSIKSFMVGLGMTFFSVFDVPVFWPILLLYWVMLLFVTMKRQILHMIKHRYLPFSWGKQKYKKGGEKGGAPAKDSK